MADDAPTTAPLLRSSTEKIGALLAQLPEYVHASQNEGLNAAYAAAIGFGINVPAAVQSLLPADPDQLDELLVTLAVQALRCRGDESGQVIVGVEGGEPFSVIVGDVEYVTVDDVATAAGGERSETDGGGSDVADGDPR
jgi:hypothetical protein